MKKQNKQPTAPREQVLDAIAEWCRASRAATRSNRGKATRTRRRFEQVLGRPVDTVLLDLNESCQFADFSSGPRSEDTSRLKVAIYLEKDRLVARLAMVREHTWSYRHQPHKVYRRREFVTALTPLAEVELADPDSLQVLADKLQPFITLHAE